MWAANHTFQAQRAELSRYNLFPCGCYAPCFAEQRAVWAAPYAEVASAALRRLRRYARRSKGRLGQNLSHHQRAAVLRSYQQVVFADKPKPRSESHRLMRQQPGFKLADASISLVLQLLGYFHGEGVHPALGVENLLVLGLKPVFKRADVFRRERFAEKHCAGIALDGLPGQHTGINKAHKIRAAV